VKGALVGGAIAAVGVATMFAVWGMTGDDDDEAAAAPPTAERPAPPPAKTTPPVSQYAAPSPADAAPVEAAIGITIPVRVRSRPAGAVVVDADGKTIGFTPLTVEVDPQHPVTLILRRDGFEEMRALVDGSHHRETFDLVRVRGTLAERCDRDPTLPECGLE
jgi:hypothetical protein